MASSYNDWIGGTEVQVRKSVPSVRKKITIGFGEDVTNWSFTSTYQTLVLDTIAYDRSNNPNLVDSIVIGTFPEVEMSAGDLPVPVDEAAGIVDFFVPANMYSGLINPGSRTNVPVTQVDFMGIDPGGLGHLIRYVYIPSYSPANTGVPGNTILDPDYTELVV